MTRFPNLGYGNADLPLMKGVTGFASLRPKLPSWVNWVISKSPAKMVGHEGTCHFGLFFGRDVSIQIFAPRIRICSFDYQPLRSFQGRYLFILLSDSLNRGVLEKKSIYHERKGGVAS